MTLRNKALVSILVTLFMFAMIIPLLSAEAADNTSMEQQVVDQINQARAEKGVAKLQVDAAITAAARQQAQALANSYSSNYENINGQPQPQQTQQPSDNNQAQPTTNDNQSVGTNVTISEFQKQVVELVNQERAKVGLNPLVAQADLTKVAQIKAEDMATNNYFSHTSPTYGSPFDMLKQFGINYNYAGENIAVGYSTPEQVMEGWMNSEGHKKNILNPNFAEIGVGFTTDGYYWVQEFAKR